MSTKNESKCKIDSNVIIGGSSYIKYGPHLYEVALLMMMQGKPYDEWDENTAYVTGDIFYILRGNFTQTDENEEKAPGIYRDFNGNAIIIPVNDKNREEYTITADNLINSNLEHIIEVLKNKESLYVSIPDNYLPNSVGELADNDTLKRALQEALLDKGIDMDLCSKRFKDKNAFLNFKQAMKNDKTKLSMMLFERGCDVFNFKFTIIVEEADPDIAIGPRLKAPIVISSDSGKKI
jgi:hypothetical protein